MSPSLLRERHGRAALLAATDDHPYIAYDVPDALAEDWWEVDGAVAFRRRRQARPVLALLGSDAGVAELVDLLPELATRSGARDGRRSAVGVSLPQHLEPLLHQRFRIGAGGDWEWFYTTTAPAASAERQRVVPLDDVARREEVVDFLAEHSPTADTAPCGGEQWVAVEGQGGRLAAVAALGRTPAGAPHISSVAVAATLRGQGLGRTIVGALTRSAVLSEGVCTLGMYSDNAVARNLYHSLGYDNPCSWASRAVALSA
ncbi:GCN5 family acetyltransferase [Intrasporangium oryzae NRRL B-24470]|uniref:GCN5 family acetyltransferase n=1 Tax=Intrasporangium oryzae NRRL B-24470 TaxID=1386089 RepID=W9GA66_9MICO|nr:GNAT family N-acetyltransferase [Intrasporangium oryzae]EWT02965.1 GCN5 family acetyltransferase [Intrasporangium oryzae NRRL B-24470]